MTGWNGNVCMKVLNQKREKSEIDFIEGENIHWFDKDC